MKSKKSKLSAIQPQTSQLEGGSKLQDKNIKHLSQREVLLQKEQKAKKQAAMFLEIKKRTRQFLLLLFAIAVIFSMIALPLLIVFS
jgi:uncharacterized protein (DUF2344 family)